MPGRVPAHRRLVFHRGAAGFSSAKPPLSSPPYKYLNLPRCCLPPREGKKKNWGEGGRRRKPRIKQRMDGRRRGRRGDTYRGRKVGARRGTSRLRERRNESREREGKARGEESKKREKLKKLEKGVGRNWKEDGGGISKKTTDKENERGRKRREQERSRCSSEYITEPKRKRGIRP